MIRLNFIQLIALVAFTMVTSIIGWRYLSGNSKGREVDSVNKAVQPLGPKFVAPRDRHISRDTEVLSGEKNWDKFALVLIDVQNDFDDAMSPDFEKNVKALLQLCRSQGIEIIHVRSGFDSGMSDWPSSYKRMLKGKIKCIRGTEGANPMPFASAEASERVFYKSNFDSFSNSKFSPYLRTAGKKHLLLAGVTTALCVFSTALSAFNSGYLVTFVEDCCGANSEHGHRFVLRRYDRFVFDRVSYSDIPSQYSHWTSRLAETD